MAIRATRPVSWIKGARKNFERFPPGAQATLLDALTVIAEGRAPVDREAAPGARRRRLGGARLPKESTSGIATPKAEIDLVVERLRRLKEALR